MDPAPGSRGLAAGLRGLAANLLSLAQTRLELLATEVEEEQVRLGGLLVYAAAAFFFFGFGVVLLALFLTVLWWDSHRMLALGVFTALFLLCGIFSAVVAARSARGGSRLFGASIAELAQDREALRDKE